MEVSLLQRRASTTASILSAPPSIIAIESATAAARDSPVSNRATCGSPEDTKTEDKRQKEEST